MKRIVVKVGSNVLTTDSGKLNITRMSSLVDQIAWLRWHGYEVILVSSGAVACGRRELQIDHHLDSVEQRQLFSAIGQVKLVNLYYDLFREYNLHVGQVLTMKENFLTEDLYRNQQACMEVMLQNGVIPVVNENDTVSVTELMFTDNDELSGLIASMVQASTLIILSNVDGIYSGQPSSGEVIGRVEPGQNIQQYIRQEKSSFGRGGMLTKCHIASQIAEEGIEVIIANGKRNDILIQLIKNPAQTVHTTFVASQGKVSSVKKWIAHSSSFSKGVVVVNKDAAKALTGKVPASVLLVGVVSLQGDFEKGDLVTIADESGRKIAIGRSDYSSKEALPLLGEHNVKPLVHYNYLSLEN